MSKSIEGRRVSAIFFQNAAMPRKPPEGSVFQVVNEFYGEHDLDWIVEYDAKGNEVARWNMKMVEGVEWDAKDPT